MNPPHRLALSSQAYMLRFPPFSSRRLRTLVRSNFIMSLSSYSHGSPDIPTFEAHVARVAKANVAPVICGTMGEAIHVSHAERIALIKAGRRALDNAGLVNFPIIAGTGAGSTRETLELSNEAAAAGADYVIVIVSGYFAGALTRPALKAFFAEVAEKSPIPVIIYNCDQQSHLSNLHPLSILL